MYTSIDDANIFAQQLIDNAPADALKYTLTVEADSGVVLDESFDSVYACAMKMAYYAKANGYKQYNGQLSTVYNPSHRYALSMGWMF